MNDGARCVATISSCPPADLLEPEWRELEAGSTGSVFLSWPWIGSVLTNPGSNFLLVRVVHGERTIGLGLLGIRHRRRYSLRPPALLLNETGDPVQDGVMTEYNGLLTLKGWEDEAADAFLAAVGTDKTLGRRDLHLSGVTGRWNALCLRHGLATRLLRSPQVAPTAALQTLPSDDPLAAMTRNCRQQIRRSMRYFEQRGPLTLERAPDTARALEWLDALEVLHTRSWRHRGKSGAFSDGAFKDFHRRLIATGFAEGVPDMLRLRAGETVLGYLYNLRRQDMAYSYQSGFDFEADPLARPGLIAHVLAMRLYRGEGMAAYRLLAGDSRYKTSLATGTDELLWMVAYRPSVTGWLARSASRVFGAIAASVRKP